MNWNKSKLRSQLIMTYARSKHLKFGIARNTGWAIKPVTPVYNNTENRSIFSSKASILSFYSLHPASLAKPHQAVTALKLTCFATRFHRSGVFPISSSTRSVFHHHHHFAKNTYNPTCKKNK